MSLDKMTATDQVAAITKYNTTPTDEMAIEGYYHAVCYSADGFIKWDEPIQNLVVTVGKNLTLDTILGNAAAGAVVMGLKGTGTAAYTDTQASHAGWLEVGATNAPTYSGTRKTPAFSASTSANPAVKTTSAAVVFAMTGSGTVAGAFINVGGSATIDNTTGVLFSAGDFTAGSKTVTSGDSINVSYTLSAAG
jgi:hypothetical protein